MNYQQATNEYRLNVLMIDHFTRKKKRLLLSNIDRKRLCEIDRELEALYRENYTLEQLYFKTNKQML
jgi:hypothetical protein